MQSQEVNENKAGNENNEGTKNYEEKQQTENSKQTQEGKQTENGKPTVDNKQTDNNNQTDEKGANYSINLAILGGVVGAGIGLFANRRTSKKVIKSLSESEFVKVTGQEFRKTAQEILAGQAQNSVKQLASGYLTKIEKSLLSPKNSGSNNSGGESQPYEEIKQENKNLNERLQKIEKMLGDLVESK
ncbi:gas vesicle protein GvpP [Bacillus sp. M6-12]|uniref:gas vesicle protein GvpP n=1 Tax=Bacillus sp. M6-12 TaxID=2054166 RepID=UPI00215536E0|nr:gas vesicle protein GvpP [Bacillus sp. M6-12]